MDNNNTTYIPLLRDTKDVHYRYKMPKLTAKVEGSGNGIKTVITNMVAIARALHRPPSYPTKYFGCELGAQVTCNGHDFVVNGAHDAEKLLTLLYSFIKKFVLCSKCNNPETELNVVDKTILQKCIACGHQTKIPNTTHRLTTFIINHPPNEDTTSSSSSKKISNKKDKTNKKKSGTRSPTSQEKKTENNLVNIDDNGFDNNDEFDEFGDGELVNDLQSIHIQQLLTDDMKERINLFYKTITVRKEQLNDINVHKELLNEAIRLGIKEKATLILSETLFTDNICDEIKKYRPLLILFCVGNKKAQKYLLGGFEKLVGEVFKDKLLNKVQTILKTFYDTDIIDEETLIEWSEKPSKKYVSKDTSKLIHEKANPFIKWLKEAEIEEDSDDDSQSNNNQQKDNKPVNQLNNYKEDDEDDDFDIEYSHRVSGLIVEQTKNNNNKTQGDTEDINIDDI